MTNLIEFHFRKSRAKDYPDIIRRCKHFTNFKQAKSANEKNKLVISSVNELINNWDDFMVIATRITSLVGSQGWFMGDEIVPFNNDFFYRIQDTIQYCYKDYISSTYQVEFCESDWGCKQLSSIQKSINPHDKWTYHMHWYRYGYFKDENKWVIDKGMILNILKKETENKYLKSCPVFDFKKVEEAVNNLPDEIELNDNWQILTKTELRENGFVEVPYSIAPVWGEPENEKIGNDDENEIKEENKSSEVDFSNLSEDEIDNYLDEYLKKRNRKKD